MTNKELSEMIARENRAYLVRLIIFVAFVVGILILAVVTHYSK